MKNIRKLILLAVVAVLMIPVCAFATDNSDVDSPGMTLEADQYIYMPVSTSKVWNGKRTNVAVVVMGNHGYETTLYKTTDSSDVGVYNLHFAYKNDEVGADVAYEIIGKDANVAVSPKSKTYKYSKKKNRYFTIAVTKDTPEAITAKSSSKYVKVSVKGDNVKVKVVKKAPKKTYKVYVKTAAGKSHKAGSAVTTVKVKK